MCSSFGHGFLFISQLSFRDMAGRVKRQELQLGIYCFLFFLIISVAAPTTITYYFHLLRSRLTFEPREPH